MGKSKIAWCDMTWNPTTGCTPAGPGCLNCYAKKMAKRLQAMNSPKYINGFIPTMHKGALDEPYHWKKPRRIFVCSMSDLFHEDFDFDFLDLVFKTINQNKRHTFQILTKRPERMFRYFDQISGKETPRYNGLSNLWVGIDAETQQAYEDQIDVFRELPREIKTLFVSCEPLLEEVDLRLDSCGDRISWVICGGESGPGARPMDMDWARSLRDQCIEADVPFFFKQTGGRNSVEAIDKVIHKEFPKEEQ